MPKEKKIILTQEEGDRLQHEGDVAVFGARDKPAMRHDVAHSSGSENPFVHMVCWEEENSCRVQVEGGVTLRGDAEAPVNVRMDHSFEGDHHQTHEVAPLDHTLRLKTALAEPMHHALQMRTPLQIRFCNPWHVASDYQFELRFGKNQLATLRVTGATVATPQPCDDPCPEPQSGPDHP